MPLTRIIEPAEEARRSWAIISFSKNRGGVCRGPLEDWLAPTEQQKWNQVYHRIAWVGSNTDRLRSLCQDHRNDSEENDDVLHCLKAGEGKNDVKTIITQKIVGELTWVEGRRLSPKNMRSISFSCHARHTRNAKMVNIFWKECSKQ